MNKLLLLLISLFLSCSTSNVADTTSGSETTNGFCVATVYDQNRNPVEGAEVYIRTESYLADTIAVQTERKPDAVTDKEGYFRIDSISEGDYTIEIVSDIKEANSFSWSTEKEPEAVTLVLEPVVSFYGMVDRENMKSGYAIYVMIRGHEYVQKVSENGHFSFSHMPPGDFELVFISDNPEYGTARGDTVSVFPSETRDVGKFYLPFDYWRDSAVIQTILDTNGIESVEVADIVVANKHGRIVQVDFTGLPVSTIPDEIADLRIKHLRLDSCNMDTLPAIIGEMSTLTILAFKGNNIRRIPENFGQLNHLNRLNMAKNLIDSLPESLINLVDLEYLLVAHNRLKDVPTPLSLWLDIHSTDEDWRAMQDL